MDNYNGLGSFLMGAAVGFAVGLLVAPESGRTIRKKIADEAEKFAGELLEEAENQIKLNKNK